MLVSADGTASLNCWEIARSTSWRTSVVWSTSSTTSGGGSSSTSMAGPCNRTRSGSRYSTSSACISQRLRPAAPRRTRSAEPKHSIAEPRNDAIRSAIRTSRRDGCSC